MAAAARCFSEHVMVLDSRFGSDVCDVGLGLNVSVAGPCMTAMYNQQVHDDSAAMRIQKTHRIIGTPLHIL